MASLFPAYVTQNEDVGSEVEEFTPGTAAGEQMVVGDLATWDDANNWIERAGTNPSAIAGICEVDSEQARLLTASGKIPIRLLKSDALVCMSSTTTPVVATHVGQEYGITRASGGQWQVDTAKTAGDARVVVRRVELSTDIGGAGMERWYVNFLAEFLSHDGIDS